jgi:hypothetical protein
LYDILSATIFSTDFGVNFGDDLNRETVQKIYSLTGFIVCKGELDHLFLVQERMHFFRLLYGYFPWHILCTLKILRIVVAKVHILRSQHEIDMCSVGHVPQELESPLNSR